MAKKSTAAPLTPKEVSPEERIAQLSHQLQEQADVASIWQEKWQESENAGINQKREVKRLQRVIAQLEEALKTPDPTPTPTPTPTPANEEA